MQVVANTSDNIVAKVLNKADQSATCKSFNNCYSNSLINEISPYLLQHAHNPVDWYTWGDEALKKAREENKPIFLSIGYSSCHWCHAMERETFTDLEIAELLNDNFIAIKVDRETRPDIDEFYGRAVLSLSGQLGWPISLFLTPETKPFQGGGYYNKTDFEKLLIDVSNNWANNHLIIINKADDTYESLINGNKVANEIVDIDSTLANKAVNNLLSISDDFNGGFGESAKFPREAWLFYLLNHSYYGEYKNEAWAALQLTLNKMISGGIYDQLGGGFHRYTIDPYWRVPHFEKMLYSQALLVSLYSRSIAIRPDERFRKIIVQTINFLLREMSDKHGGFYSSIDAESEGIEGKYYSWSEKEIDTILTAEESKLVKEIYGIDKYGDLDSQENVIYLSTSITEYLNNTNALHNSLRKKLLSLRTRLLEERNKRIKPLTDHKKIMAWNALTITALTEASIYLNQPEYLALAIKSANFIWDNFQTKDGFKRIRYKGVNAEAAQLEDYAYYLQSLVSLYDVSKKKVFLNRAIFVADQMLESFWDTESGGFYNVAKYQQSSLSIRPKISTDKTFPSANSVASNMLTRLSARTGNKEYLEKATDIISAFSSKINEVPHAYTGLLIVSNEIDNGEIDLPIYAANGHIRIDAVITKKSNKYYQLNIELSMEDNWHINSHTPLSNEIIPLKILSDNKDLYLKDIIYPQHEVVNLGLSHRPLAVYQDKIIITSHVSNISFTRSAIKIELQACNDKLCLPPESHVLYPRVLN